MQRSISEISSDRRGETRKVLRVAARYSSDGHHWASAMLVSLGAGGAFLETHRTLDAGTRVLLELDPFDALLEDGLGDPELLLRLPAEIAYLDRRNGTRVVPGLGLRIPPLTDEFVERIAWLLERDPGAAPAGPGGTMCWPLGLATGAPSTGLSMRTESGWQLIPGGACPEQTVTSLLEHASKSGGSVVVAYDGWCLIPSGGMPAVAPLSETTLSALIHLMLTQVTLIDVQREHRLDGLEACHLGIDRAKRALLDAQAETGGHDFGDAVAHLDELERVRGQWAWTLRSIASMRRPPVAVSAPDLEWLVDGPAEQEFHGAPAPAPAPPPSRAPGASLLMRVGASMAAGMFVGLIGVAQMSRHAEAQSREQVSALDFQDLFPLEEVEVDGPTLRAVAENWMQQSPAEQELKMLEICLRAEARGFDHVELRTPRGTRLASCDGSLTKISSET